MATDIIEAARLLVYRSASKKIEENHMAIQVLWQNFMLLIWP